MFDRPDHDDQAVLVHVNFSSPANQEALDEFRELVVSAGAEPVDVITASRVTPDPRLFIGSGKAAEIREALELHGCSLVLFNHELQPGQERNLERELQARVLDRTGLILDIFAQRAQSFEGKLQVELAQLRHLSTRLVRGWTHLERQKGGIGLRGPGEKQLETDRRLLGQRIKQLTQRLEKVRNQRQVQRKSRRKAELPVVSLVGYTNAGKSTLFNQLTQAGVYQADQLFATLDPTLRRIDLGRGRAAVLADTVGFIRHLPHDLVAAFRSTLEETREADLLLHVIDASDPEREAKVEQVNNVLEEIDALDVPQIQVFNKIDRVQERQPGIQRDDGGRGTRVWLSAANGEGLEALLELVAEQVSAMVSRYDLRLPMSRGDLRAKLFRQGMVVSEKVQDEDWILKVEMSEPVMKRLCSEHGLTALQPAVDLSTTEPHVSEAVE